MDRLPVRRDGPPKGVPVFQPPQKVEEHRARQKFYRAKPWRSTRAVKLRRDPLCEHCKAAGRLEPATQVHHVLERLDRPDLAYDLTNLESLCASCHSRISRHRINKRHGETRPKT